MRRAGKTPSKRKEPGLQIKTRPTSAELGRVLFSGPASPFQKSNCALSLNKRGSRIDCGVLHAAPNVAFSVSTEFELVML